MITEANKKSGKINTSITKLIKYLYPENGNLIVIAGATQSHQAFAIDNLLEEDIILSAERREELSRYIFKISNILYFEYKIDMRYIDSKDPEHIDKLNKALKICQAPIKEENPLLYSILFSTPEQKPNLVFDSSISTFMHFRKVMSAVANYRYFSQKIHLIWVINDFETALQLHQNYSEADTNDSYIKAFYVDTMWCLKDILNRHETLRTYLDGDVWLVLNKQFMDSFEKFSYNFPECELIDLDNPFKFTSMTNIKFIKVKTTNKDNISWSNFNKEVKTKVLSYMSHQEY